MGDPEGWPQPNGLTPEGSSIQFLSLDDEQWLQAEDRTLELIIRIQPTGPSEERRKAVSDYVVRLIKKCITCEVHVFGFGSVPLKTYLPDGDIDLTLFTRNPVLWKESWAKEVQAALEALEHCADAEFRVKEVQFIQAEVKIIKCLVENIVVDISFDQISGLCTLCFLEEVDRLIGRDHLFKRSIILVKAWCYYESRILGAHHGLISTYALETLVLYIFHVFHESLRGPLGVLFRFLEFFSRFDWDNYCVSLWGPVPLSRLPNQQADLPLKNGGNLLLSEAFVQECSQRYSTTMEPQPRTFPRKFFNVIDPLKTSNNLGRSVSQGNFHRIRSAFSYGARNLARILECSKESVVEELDKFFLNTWDRHGSGKRPDAPEAIERIPLHNGSNSDETDTPDRPQPEKKNSTKPKHGDIGVMEFSKRSSRQHPDREVLSIDADQDMCKPPFPDLELLDRLAISPTDVPGHLRPPLWGNADIPAFYPRARPILNHVDSRLEDMPMVPHPPWDPVNRHPDIHHLQAPGPPPLKVPFGHPPGPKELSPETPVVYEPNGLSLDDDDNGNWPGLSHKGKATLQPDRTKGRFPQKKSKAADEHRPVEGPFGDPWPHLDQAMLHYQIPPPPPVGSSSSVVYPGLPSDSPEPSPNSEFPAQKPGPSHSPPTATGGGTSTSPQNQNPPRPGGSSPHSRKSRPPDFYYPVTYVPVYGNSYPMYVMPPEAGVGGDFPLPDDNGHLFRGVGEGLAAVGIPVSCGSGINGDVPRDGRFDLLRSDFATHLRNLDYGRRCQQTHVFIQPPIFSPFPKEHHMWEGPGRPNMKQAGHGRGSRNFHRAGFGPPPGFGGDDVSKPRPGTGTYLPGRHKDRQFRGHNDGYQERNDFVETPPRYQRSMGRGQNNRNSGKFSDKGWHDNFNARNAGQGSTSPGQMQGINLDYPQVYMNGNGATTTAPVVLVYPYGNANEHLEFGSLGPMPERSLRPERSLTPTQHPVSDRQQHQQQPVQHQPLQHQQPPFQPQQNHQPLPSSPKEQRPTQLTYEMKEEDFPPLSFKGQGGGSPSSNNNVATTAAPRGSSFQTYVASQS